MKKKIYCPKTSQNKAAVTILIPEYILKPRLIPKIEKVILFYHLKGPIHQEGTIILNIYVSSNKV